MYFHFLKAGQELVFRIHMLFGTCWIAVRGLSVIYIPVIIHSMDVTKISNDDRQPTHLHNMRIFPMKGQCGVHLGDPVH